MITIGKVDDFVVLRENNSGYQLKKQESGDEVFMPPALAIENLVVGQELKAFAYLDSTGAPVATSKLPYAQVGEYALLEVIDVQEFGAFMDWGISKDLLIPGNQQKEPLKQGERYLVRVCLEERTNRIFGTTKIGRYIKESSFDIKEGDKVDIVPVKKGRLGYRSIINKKFIGMIYFPEIFCEITFGQSYAGVVKKLREDGLVDAALQVQGVKKFVDSKDQILNMLKGQGGHSPLNDKSSPDDIKKALQMSKQTFKRTIGILYKERKIVISKDGISLTSEK